MKRFLLNKILQSRYFLFIFSSSHLLKCLFKNDTVVFMFHEVNNCPSEFHQNHNLNIKPKIFREQLAFIGERFNVISPTEFLLGDYRKPAAMLTFDDGAKGFATFAAQILKEFQFPGLIFLNMAPVKGEVFWSGLSTYLCKKDNEFREIINPDNDPLKVGNEFLYVLPEHLKNTCPLKAKIYFCLK